MIIPATVEHSFDYHHLRNLARAMIRYEKQCTLSATALVHELYLKRRVQKKPVDNDTNSISPKFASRMMRQILIDRARARIARKKRETVKCENHGQSEDSELEKLERVLDFEKLVARLADELPINAELVRLHIYSEYSIEECADILKISRATAYRKWQFSKAWLQSQFN